MKKFIIPIIVSITVFLTITLAPYKAETKLDKIKVEFNIRVLEDDIFQLFYLQEGILGYSEKQSKYTEIKGNSNYQKISFTIQPDKPLYKIRLDIGHNTNQKPVIIKTAKMIVSGRSFDFNLPETFSPNNYIEYVNGEYITKSIPSLAIIYDPFIVSNINLSDFFKLVQKKQTQNRKLLVITIATIFSLALFFFLLNKNIQIQKITSNLYIIIFLLILITPTFYKLFTSETETGNKEKRVLAVKPNFELDKEYPIKYENYFNDNFGLRSTIIKWASKIKVDIFEVSSKPELVLFGQNGFLYYNSFTKNTTPNILPDDDIKMIYQKHFNLKKVFAEKKIRYILGYWPDKQTIYKENFSFVMEKQTSNEITLAKQVATYFNKNSFLFFDVSHDLLKAKNNYQVYYKFDTHWNNYGTYEAYRSFCTQTQSDLSLSPFEINEFILTTRLIKNGDLTNMLGIDSMSRYSDERQTFILKDKTKGFTIISAEGYPNQTIITENKNSEKNEVVLVFGDSFMTAFRNLLSLHYSKVIYIWAYPSYSHPINREAIVDKVKPDIIINCSVERYLPDLLH